MCLRVLISFGEEHNKIYVCPYRVFENFLSIVLPKRPEQSTNPFAGFAGWLAPRLIVYVLMLVPDIPKFDIWPAHSKAPIIFVHLRGL